MIRTARRAPARWPLLLLALPAGVATWSGWVGLGEKTGFGLVTPLPGIADDFQINTAITLPIGVETYAAYALGTWLSSSPMVSASTRRFAKWSSIGSLLLGMLGQVAYHLLEVAGFVTAPGWIVTVVSCLPVLVLGMGAGLGHMLSRDAQEHTEAEAVPVPVGSPTPLSREVAEALMTARYWAAHRGHFIDLPAELSEVSAGVEGTPDVFTAESWDAFTTSTVSEARTVPAAAVDADTPEVDSTAGEPADLPAEPVEPPAKTTVLVPAPDPLWATAAQRYADVLAEGQVPPLSRIKKDLKVGQPRAARVRLYLDQLAQS
ncbi:hypothetical protein GCM10010517_36420 [Streptosporangium fragile]|uniref:DUF2637 domain-containing protein n=1 Tax=Streptosporangium fragile TaxID=46186 RepID=A0ABN3VZ11_9ACTN